MNADRAEALRAVSRDLGLWGAMALVADLEAAEADLRVNANRKLLVEAVLAGVLERSGRPRGRSATTPRAGFARNPTEP